MDFERDCESQSARLILAAQIEAEPFNLSLTTNPNASRAGLGLNIRHVAEFGKGIYVKAKTDLSYLLFFCATAVLLEGIATWSSIDVFPQMKGKLLLSFVATVILAGLIHHIADEYDPDLKQKGVICFVILNIALLINCVQHFDFGREIDASKQGAVEINAQKDKDLAREKERAAMAAQLADANTRQLKAGRDALIHTPTKKAGAFLEKLQSTLVTAAQEPPDARAAPVPPAFVTLTPAEVRAELMPRLFWGFVLSFGLAVLLATLLFAYKQLDQDKNGIQDWVERAAENLGEEKFRKAYPEEYGLHKARLFPNA